MLVKSPEISTRRLRFGLCNIVGRPFFQEYFQLGTSQDGHPGRLHDQQTTLGSGDGRATKVVIVRMLEIGFIEPLTMRYSMMHAKCSLKAPEQKQEGTYVGFLIQL